VGLLNIGEEEGKGNAVAKEAFELLKVAPGLHFVGNVEGRDVVAGHPGRGRTDVVVCDGFTGNAILKFYEAVERVLHEAFTLKAPGLLASDDVQRALHFLEHSQYGGAPLLGVRGTCIICHGSSSANAIKNGIRVAIQAVTAGLTSHIGAQFTQRDLAGRA
jgi:glycerol-3-phosphate acyltransferase PlsX